MISGINPWFPILSIKILEYALVFQNAFIDSIIEQAALKTRKLFLFQLLHVKLDVNPLSLHVTYILSLYFALFFFVCYFLSWIMSRSLTSQIITITTKSDNVIRGGAWYLEKRGSRKILVGSRNLGSVFDKSRNLVFAWFVFTFFWVSKLFTKESGARISN